MVVILIYDEVIQTFRYVILIQGVDSYFLFQNGLHINGGGALENPLWVATQPQRPNFTIIFFWQFKQADLIISSTHLKIKGIGA